jgi:NADH-quinone oxidoreductase subunit G
MSDATTDTTPTEQPAGVPVTINGREIHAREGELVIDAAERNGIYVPRFCYHPRMKPVGMCRMCIVEVDTGRGPSLQPTCMLECTPGMVVDTESEVTKKAQDGVLEFLLINHPLDCPVCDKGGECPLQDQTMAYGPGESRFVEEKRHFEKPIPISDLVQLDRERCILCDRCTRFAKDVAGDPLIHFLHRGSSTEVNTFPDHPFASYFSGNTVQICPVGALTATNYRFRARPWDLEETESTCQQCSVGCRIAVQSSRNEVLRYVGVDVDPVNWGWLCDKGRFGFEALHHDERLAEPLARAGDELIATRWSDAVGRAADALRGSLDASGPDAVAVIGGARLTNESAYAWAKLAKGVIGTDNVDAQLGDGLPAEVILGLPRATIDDVCRPGGTVRLLAPDLKEELPVLFLRLRHAIVEDGVTVVEIAPHDTGLTDLVAVSLPTRPGEQGEVAKVLVGSAGADREVGGVAPALLGQARALVAAADAPVTVVIGRQNLAESGAGCVDAASVLVGGMKGVRFLSALRRANVHGALDMGLAPGVLPGRVSLDAGRDWFGHHWPVMPARRGLDTTGILRAAADGQIDVLVLLGADPLGDFPDRDLASRALAGARTVIAVDQFLTESSRQADVVLPVAGFAEVDGTSTNLEGRVTSLGRRITAPGTAQADWVVAADLARHLGADLGLESSAAIRAEIEALAPAYAGVTDDVLIEGLDPDGVVVPLPVTPPGVAQTAAATAVTDPEAEAPAPADDSVEAGPSGEGPSGDDTADGGPERPAMFDFEPAPSADLAPVDSYSLRLAATRKLYDSGVLVQHAPSLAGLTPGTVLRVNPHDFSKLGIEDHTRVRVKSSRAELALEVEVDAAVPRGTAAVVFNQPGVPVSDLIDATQVVNEVRIEREVD